jgi:hypothetical protein
MLTRSFSILNRLGTCLEFGLYSGSGVKLAAECYFAAATEGDSDAQANCGFCLEYGVGVERNPSEAVELCCKSMKQNNPVGTAQYALCLHFGCGCWADVEAAVDHYDFVVNRRSLLVDNAARCFRALDKPPSPKREIERKPPVPSYQSVAGLDMVRLIHSLETGPIGTMSQRNLGEGSFGKVTREKDPQNPENEIAVKWFWGFTDWSSFLREVETLVKLRHPCVVQIVSWSGRDRNSGIFEIRMKLAANGALRHYLGHGRHAYLGRFQDATAKARLICDIVMGMKYVHSKGIIHRDLNPANILLDESWRGVIGDFGLSRSRSPTGMPSPYAGTRRYAAPEQWNATVPYTEKVDVFTFGLVAYEIIRGFLPAFTENGSPELPNLPVFGSLMQDLLSRCWSLNPICRPSFQAIFDQFQASGWTILPGTDAKTISESVSEVIALEHQLNS